MTISADKLQRSQEALALLTQLRKDYADVLVVLDYVSFQDIANYEPDFDDPDRDGEHLTDDEVESVLWRLGKHVGSSETSVDLLPNIVQFVVDERERKKQQHP